VLTAALISAVCSVLAWRRLAKLERLAPPAATTLLLELEAQNPARVGEQDSEQQRLSMIADLNQRLADVSFELELLRPTFAALTRVCLASGTALTLLGLLGSMGSPTVGAARAVMCAVSGLVGVSVVSALGRTAKRVVERTREAWDRTSRDVGRSLHTDQTASRQ
jgi:hypothetical protein